MDINLFLFYISDPLKLMRRGVVSLQLMNVLDSLISALHGKFWRVALRLATQNPLSEHTSGHLEPEQHSAALFTGLRKNHAS